MGRPKKLSFYQIARETVAPSDHTNWPTAAVAGFVQVPISENSLKLTNVPSGIDRYTGYIDEVYRGITGQTLAGGITTQLWPDNAEMLLDFSLKRVSNIMESYTIKGYSASGNEGIRWTGLMCNQATISASDDDKELTLALDLMGKDEDAIATPGAASMPSAMPFVFSDATFNLWGEADADILGFTLTTTNNLKIGPVGGSNRRVRWIDSGYRGVELSVTVDSADATYQAYMRDRSVSGNFTATFNYPGSGSPVDSIVLSMARITLTDLTDEGGPNDIGRVTLAGTGVMLGETAAVVYSVS